MTQTLINGKAGNLPVLGALLLQADATRLSQKRRTGVRLLRKLHDRGQRSLHNIDIVSQFTSERIKYNLV